DPAQVSYADLLRRFWEGHDPTQGMRQGNDVGTQYRSAGYLTDDTQRDRLQRSRAPYHESLTPARHRLINTQIAPFKASNYAEDYHQQYWHKILIVSCGLGATGVSCPVGLAT